MRRFDSPKLKISQTHYPEQTYSRERLPTPGVREDSVDHLKYKPIMRQSSSKLQTPPVASRNNLFESALKKNQDAGQFVSHGDSKRSVLTSGTVTFQSTTPTLNIKAFSNNPVLDSITRTLTQVEPRAVRELVEKNALFEKKDQELASRIKGAATAKPGVTAFISRPATQEVQSPKPAASRIQSPSSSNLYKPFFPGARTPK